MADESLAELRAAFVAWRSRKRHAREAVPDDLVAPEHGWRSVVEHRTVDPVQRHAAVPARGAPARIGGVEHRRQTSTDRHAIVEGHGPSVGPLGHDLEGPSRAPGQANANQGASKVGEHGCDQSFEICGPVGRGLRRPRRSRAAGDR